jgi:uncharacterized protein (DUF433 family)
MSEPEQSPVHLMDRITTQPDVMGGKPTIRGLRMTVGTIIGLLAAGHSIEKILQDYPYWKKPIFARLCTMPPGAWKKSNSRWVHEILLDKNPFPSLGGNAPIRGVGNVTLVARGRSTR